MPIRLGPLELVLILVIVLAIFGAGKLGNLGGAIGKGMKDFRKEIKDASAEDQQKKDESVEK